MKKRFTEEQIIGFLREADAGLPVKELCRKHRFSEPNYYAWKAKFGGMNVSDAQRLKSLESENAKLKKLLANSMLEIDAMREVLPLLCPMCGGQMRIIAFITHSAEIRHILNHIGVESAPPHITPARGPPLWEGCDAPVDDGAQGEPDWDLAAQPDEVDQRVNW